MTNIQPQLHSLNAGPWKSLETWERKLVSDAGKELYIVAGGMFDSKPKKIGPGISVPKSSYRITVVLEPGQAANDVTKDTPVYAVVMPNGVRLRPHIGTVRSPLVPRVQGV